MKRHAKFISHSGALAFLSFVVVACSGEKPNTTGTSKDNLCIFGNEIFGGALGACPPALPKDITVSCVPNRIYCGASPALQDKAPKEMLKQGSLYQCNNDGTVITLLKECPSMGLVDGGPFCGKFYDENSGTNDDCGCNEDFYYCRTQIHNEDNSNIIYKCKNARLADIALCGLEAACVPPTLKNKKHGAECNNWSSDLNPQSSAASNASNASNATGSTANNASGSTNGSSANNASGSTNGNANSANAAPTSPPGAKDGDAFCGRNEKLKDMGLDSKTLYVTQGGKLNSVSCSDVCVVENHPLKQDHCHCDPGSKAMGGNDGYQYCGGGLANSSISDPAFQDNHILYHCDNDGELVALHDCNQSQQECKVQADPRQSDSCK